MQLHLFRPSRFPVLQDAGEARQYRAASKVYKEVRPVMLALSESIAERDEEKRFDHKPGHRGDVVVVDKGLSYQARSPDHDLILWESRTVNVESGQVRFDPETSELLEASLDFKDHSLGFRAGVDHDTYQVTRNGETQKIRVDRKTGLISFEEPTS